MSEEIKEILESYINHNEIEIILDRIKEIVDNEIIDYGEELSLSECKCLLNYITNLQKENEKLQEENKHIFSRVNDDELLISNAMNYAELQDYKSRNEKAIEYVEKSKLNQLDTYCKYLYINFATEKIEHLDDLLIILQGGDE